MKLAERSDIERFALIICIGCFSPASSKLELDNASDETKEWINKGAELEIKMNDATHNFYQFVWDSLSNADKDRFIFNGYEIYRKPIEEPEEK